MCVWGGLGVRGKEDGSRDKGDLARGGGRGDEVR